MGYQQPKSEISLSYLALRTKTKTTNEESRKSTNQKRESQQRGGTRWVIDRAGRNADVHSKKKKQRKEK